MTISNIFSKATGPVVNKIHIGPPGADGTRMCSNDLDHMTNISVMPIHTCSKNL